MVDSFSKSIFDASVIALSTTYKEDSTLFIDTTTKLTINIWCARVIIIAIFFLPKYIDTYMYVYLHIYSRLYRCVLFWHNKTRCVWKSSRKELFAGKKVSEICQWKKFVYIWKQETLSRTRLFTHNLLRRKRCNSLRPGRSGTNLLRRLSFINSTKNSRQLCECQQQQWIVDVAE